jgi:cold shock CspA family protein
MFLDAPHESHRHEAKLLESYAGDADTRRIFREDHSPAPYFVCAQAWYKFEKYFREGGIDRKYRPYKAHLLLIFRYSLGQPVPKLVKSKTLEVYCDNLLALLDEARFVDLLAVVLDAFDRVEHLWRQRGGSQYGIKDNREFTDLLTQQVREQFSTCVTGKAEDAERDVSRGVVLRIVWRHGVWFGFIKRGADLENVYFDSRGFRGDPDDLAPGTRVKLVVAKGERGVFARSVVAEEPHVGTNRPN